DAGHLVGTDRRPDPAAADRDAALHFAGGDRPGERDDVVGVVVARVEPARTKVDHLMPLRPQPGEQLLFQPEPAMVSCDPQAHAPLPPDRWLPPSTVQGAESIEFEQGCGTMPTWDDQLASAVPLRDSPGLRPQ